MENLLEEKEIILEYNNTEILVLEFRRILFISDLTYVYKNKDKAVEKYNSKLKELKDREENLKNMIQELKAEIAISKLIEKHRKYF